MQRAMSACEDETQRRLSALAIARQRGSMAGWSNVNGVGGCHGSSKVIGGWVLFQERRCFGTQADAMRSSGNGLAGVEWTIFLGEKQTRRLNCTIGAAITVIIH